MAGLWNVAEHWVTYPTQNDEGRAVVMAMSPLSATTNKTHNPALTAWF